MGVTPRRRALAAAAVLAVAALGLTACGDSKDKSSSGSEQITLNVDVFGNFGYEELYKQYMTEHPNIKIVERGTGSQLGDYTQQVTQRLAAGSGLGDVIAIEEGMSIDIMAKSSNFADLGQYGAKDLAGNFLDWKQKAVTTSDGKIIGLGTDVGGMAMCYRTDLFAKAGLPTNRDDVSKLWPTWDDYINVGKTFKSKVPDAGFIDAVTNTYNSILMQEAGNTTGYTYFDPQGNFVGDSNPAVKKAWDTSVQILNAGLSAKPGVDRPVERGLQERQVRDHRLPRLDDRLHHHPERRRRQGQVGHRQGSGQRWQLGRLVARRAEAEQAPEGGR